jgi:hypothetical protein
VTRLEALLLKQLEMASKGNSRAFEKLLALYMKLPAKQSMETREDIGHTETDQAVLEDFARTCALLTLAPDNGSAKR